MVNVNVKFVGDERIGGQVSKYDVIYEAGLVTDCSLGSPLYDVTRHCECVSVLQNIVYALLK